MSCSLLGRKWFAFAACLVGIKMLKALLFWKQDWGILKGSNLADLLGEVDEQRIIG